MQFLSIAKGSAAELETQLLIGMDIGYIEESLGRSWLAELQDVQAMLTGLIKRYRNTTR